MSGIDPFEQGFVTNPAELALQYVPIIDGVEGPEAQTVEEHTLAELDRLSEIGDMPGTYFAQTGRALAIPASFESNEVIGMWDFNNLTFEGKLVTYSVVNIGRIIGGTSVRALCLTFDEVTLLPFFDNLVDGQLLHVPALAVDSMTKTASA